MGLNPVSVTYTSDMAPASNKESLEFHAINRVWFPSEICIGDDDVQSNPLYR